MEAREESEIRQHLYRTIRVWIMSSNHSIATKAFWQIIRLIPIFAGAAAGYHLGYDVAGRLLYGMRDGGVQRAETFVFWMILGGGLGCVAGVLFNEVVSYYIRKRTNRNGQT